jgi:hypothetical protein
MNRHLLVVAAAAVLAACSARDAKPVAKADPPYIFPHSPHVDGDVDCKNCHASILKATALENRVRHVGLPKKSDACSGCHDEIPKITIPARTREFDVRFNHAAHLAKPGVECKTCHTAPPEAKQVEPARVSMSACTACHQHAKDFAEARCTPCHRDLKKYEKPVASFRHDGEWLKLHGALAQPTAESCAQCHEQTFCADCHSATTVPVRQSIAFPEEVKRDFIHRGDFVSRHMIEAGAGPASCRKCHGSQFCDSCHALQNVSPLSTNPTLRDPHPAGWSDARLGNLHAAAARRNILACAACHDHGPAAAETVCLGCHQSGTNPHPPGFLSKHRSDDRSKGVCRACHTSG